MSKTLNHIVFIFLGDINRCKDEFIDQNRHLTLSLCHPAKYSYEDNSHLRKDRDWRTMMPFINANFYRYQAGNKLVDWGDVNGLNSERKNVRLNQLRNLFEEAIELGDPTEGSCRRIDDDLIVVLNMKPEEYLP
ncbi:Uracil-DNA glycosylase [Orchesella cincta]|uniref:Uracil-DNA glycosylase n=1 Tax=Orchesella cincta TaxID=48709 RepID=A0A1D2M8D7_ORCCI|nr:Uracil-DNA glycosylase [Orchesella cincta]